MGLKHKAKKKRERERVREGKKRILFLLANLNFHIFLTKTSRVAETIPSYLQELGKISAPSPFY